MTLSKKERFTNREFSFLLFNERVLNEAEQPDLPVLERLKFLAIVASNLDEFFMVRVALCQRAREAQTGSLGPDGLPPSAVLKGISTMAHGLVERQYTCLVDQILPALAAEGVHLVTRAEMTPEDREALQIHFHEHLGPVLTPLAVDPSHPLPLLANGGIYLYFRVQPREAQEDQFYAQTQTVLIQVPAVLQRFVPLPTPPGTWRFALLDDVIHLLASEVIGGYEIQGAYAFRVTRDADITVDEEQAENLLTAVEQQLRHRRRGSPVRLEVDSDMAEEVVTLLQETLSLEAGDIYRMPVMLNLRSLFSLVDQIDRPDLLNPDLPPQPHPLFLGEDPDLFRIMQEQDFALHLPYQRFGPVVQLVRQAAADKQVLAIKITLYRVSGDSPIVQALMDAAEQGKQVTVLVELRARFDEEANIQWARRLGNAGAHVIYGVVGYKTHSKALLIVRREADGIQRYVHLSTGNYNDRTARLYTDLGYFTARPSFGADISAFFNVITGYSLPPVWNHIEMAPTGLRNKLLALIERETELHTDETPGLIRAKMNSIIDPDVIDALYRASQAGVQIQLIIRGLCRLRAGVPGLSETISVVSIVDRFLEHPRIYHFHNSGKDEVYLASADCMERNLDKRLELFFPLLADEVKQQALTVLDVGLEDNCHGWDLQPDNTYRRRTPGPCEKERRSQLQLYHVARDAARARRRNPQREVFEVRTEPDE